MVYDEYFMAKSCPRQLTITSRGAGGEVMIGDRPRVSQRYLIIIHRGQGIVGQGCAGKCRRKTQSTRPDNYNFTHTL